MRRVTNGTFHNSVGERRQIVAKAGPQGRNLGSISVCRRASNNFPPKAMGAAGEARFNVEKFAFRATKLVASFSPFLAAIGFLGYALKYGSPPPQAAFVAPILTIGAFIVSFFLYSVIGPLGESNNKSPNQVIEKKIKRIFNYHHSNPKGALLASVPMASLITFSGYVGISAIIKFAQKMASAWWLCGGIAATVIALFLTGVMGFAVRRSSCPKALKNLSAADRHKVIEVAESYVNYLNRDPKPFQFAAEGNNVLLAFQKFFARPDSESVSALEIAGLTLPK